MKYNMQASMAIAFITLAISPTIILSSPPIAKPGCVDRCGDISIPFPFGTTPECYWSDIFWVICNATHYHPPKLFWQNSTVEITDISLDGQSKVLQFIAKDCYDHNGNRTPWYAPWIELPPYFTINNTANKFTIVGCDAYALVSGYRLNNRTFKTGCTAMCSSESDLTEGSCMGVGCCQTPIPDNAWRMEIGVTSYTNYTDVWEFNNCGFAFVVEDRSFSFSKDNLTNLKDVESLPLVLDWALGNGTCEEAKMDAATYACLSPNSGCYEPQIGYGYRCHCNEGFEGNPYLKDGCIDINECLNETRNDCTMKESCMNVPGDYTCSCPKGYSGNGRGEDGCEKTIASNKRDMKIVYVVIGVASVIIALLLFAVFLYSEIKRRSSKKTKQKFFIQNGGIQLQEKLSRREGTPDGVRIFSSAELEKATNNFHDTMIIGRGGFGMVYKGLLPDNRIVAIKRSIRIDPTQIDQFINEVFVLSQVNHRNVVRLLGCCLETDVPLLVYEFINNGTLSSHIHNQSKARSFYWGMRLKIAAEVAGVLSYLHSSASTPIIHRDVKSDNILLDHTFTAKVSDFGASKLIPLDLTQLSTIVQGTFGYLDPEYMQTNQLTEKSDVYSFGVVLLELITGRKALSFDRPVEEKNLAHYFLSMLKQDRLFEIVDDSIDGLENREQICEVARLARECLNVKGEDRPIMKEVAMELEGMIMSGKHAWSRNAEEMESLPLKDEGVNHFVNGDGNSSSMGYDSIRDHVLLPISGGR